MTTPSPASRNRTAIVIAAVVAVVVVAAVLALVLTGGDDDEDVTSTSVAVTSVSDTAGAGTDGTTAATGDTTGSGATGGTAAAPPLADPIDPLNAELSVSGDALAPHDSAASPDPAIGTRAPALTGTNYLGQPVSITPGEDGPLMVVFMAHWCPHCNNEIPILNDWAESGDVPENLRVVAVSTAVAADRPNFPPGAWLAEKGWRWEVLADGPQPSANEPPPALEAYGITGFPSIVAIDADGNVVGRTSGEIPLEQIQALAADATG